ncbi:hypothetical protein [Phocaeicola sp.]|uniref:hypothetical protein n=1 Tax=Phocaeicola sp. TaxID=2773926 RepID=UPI003A902842
MKPQEKQGCLIGIGLLVSWFVLFFLSIEFDSPFLKGISFGLPGFAVSFVFGKYFGVKEFQWKTQRDLPLILLGLVLLVFFTWIAYGKLW